MHRSPNKIFASLLAILLVMAPFPSILGAVSASSGNNANSHAMMNMADSDRKVAMSEVADESDPCEHTDHCNGEGCIFGHCLTCVAGVFTAAPGSASTTFKVIVPQLDGQFFTQNSLPLFRPPKA